MLSDEFSIFMVMSRNSPRPTGFCGFLTFPYQFSCVGKILAISSRAMTDVMTILLAPILSITSRGLIKDARVTDRR